MKTQVRLAVVILAAGLSRRMGSTDKLIMEFLGQPVFMRALALAKGLKPFCCAVVTNTAEIRRAAEEAGFAVTENPHAASGIASSIVCGIRALPDRYDQVLFLNADQPLLRLEVVRRIVAAGQSADCIFVPRCGGEPKSPCLFPVRFCAELEQLSGDKGGRQVYRRHPEEVRFIDFMEPEDFFDIDTQEDLEEALNSRRNGI